MPPVSVTMHALNLPAAEAPLLDEVDELLALGELELLELEPQAAASTATTPSATAFLMSPRTISPLLGLR
jgi:hypothetical protein